MERILRRCLPLLAALLMASACATPPEPFEYVSEREFKQGPGLFSGEDGKVTLFPWGGGSGDQEKGEDTASNGEPAPDAP